MQHRQYRTAALSGRRPGNGGVRADPAINGIVWILGVIFPVDNLGYDVTMLVSIRQRS